MPERKEQPPQHLLNPGTAHPAYMIKRQTILHGFGNMALYFINNSFVVSKEHYFVLIAKTAIIDIGRANSECFSIYKQKLGVQIINCIKYKTYFVCIIKAIVFAA